MGTPPHMPMYHRAQALSTGSGTRWRAGGCQRTTRWHASTHQPDSQASIFRFWLGLRPAGGRSWTPIQGSKYPQNGGFLPPQGWSGRPFGGWSAYVLGLARRGGDPPHPPTPSELFGPQKGWFLTHFDRSWHSQGCFTGVLGPKIPILG